MAPSSTLLYFALDVRPQGSQGTRIHATLNELFGSSAERAIRGLGHRLMGGQVQPWWGQHIGMVITQFVPGATGIAGKSGVAVIIPTGDPAAAQAWIAKLTKRNPGEMGKVIDGYAVFGGPVAYQQVLATSPGNSLASSPRYQATVGELGGSPAAIMWMNPRGFIGQLAARIPKSSAISSALKRSLARLGPNSAAAVGLNLTPSAISLNLDETGVRQSSHRSPANVGGLPGASWLALATNWFPAKSQEQLQEGFQSGLLGALGRSSSGAGALTDELVQRLAFVGHDVLPALGPLSLAVGGTSPFDLTAGLELAPSSQAAATRLLSLLRGLAARSPSLSVTGKATNFSVKSPTGSRVLARQAHRQVIATYGFPSQSAFLSPASKLSQNPTYRQALAQLPGATSVPLYVSFGPIAALVALLDHTPSAAKTVRALDKLNYLILGSGGGRERLVLGLR